MAKKKRTRKPSKAAWNRLNERIVNCKACPRLIKHCRNIAKVKRRAYEDQNYWGLPVPNFGPKKFSGVPLLIVGLAPGAHGANRTGRMFTGDRSGDWLFRAMHRAGFASQAQADHQRDGLELFQCAITAVCQCAPPDNKPDRSEINNCRPFLVETIELCQPRVFLALGGLAWRATIDFAISQDWVSAPRPKPKFGHGARVELADGRTLLGCYHVSQQNTFTGRLTEKMLDDVFDTIKGLIRS